MKPYAPHALNSLETEDSAETADAPRPARILVVDDDPLICGLHALVLERAGYEVITAENGHDALIQLAFEPFDLVITDRTMPVLDGVSMVLALRSAGSRIPVVMVSGSLTHSPLPPGVACEVSAALPKPARPAEMLAAVRQALQPAPRVESPRPAMNGHAFLSFGAFTDHDEIAQAS